MEPFSSSISCHQRARNWLAMKLVCQVIDLVVWTLDLAAMELSTVVGHSRCWRLGGGGLFVHRALNLAAHIGIRSPVAYTGRGSVRSPRSVRLLISTTLVWPRSSACVYVDLALRLGRPPPPPPPYFFPDGIVGGPGEM
jgi:hypothetical protein